MKKLETLSKQSGYQKLSSTEQNFITAKHEEFSFTFSQLKTLIDVSLDYHMWQEAPLSTSWPTHLESDQNKRQVRDAIYKSITDSWDKLKQSEKDYSQFEVTIDKERETTCEYTSSKHTILGECPVASNKTRCCNLKTLDAVRNCGYDCSYCSIQSFYYDNKVYFDDKLKEKLNTLKLDSEKIYHIGTGQSSDSLMWGNKDGLLEHLFKFAHENSNVILELKTKSSNVKDMLEIGAPKNVITTWTLNSETIIKNEEHLTASLDERLAAAREVADSGRLVGFHLHPMVIYKEWRQEYTKIFLKIQEMFKPSEVALISFGTLTFIKPVIKQLKKRAMTSKILQMPLVDAEGKLSYPLETKRDLFKHAYDSFSKEWQDLVFFYMCMEDPTLWRDVFGYEYAENDDFEDAMNKSYMDKINSL